jgi:hypothetical protein
MSPTINILCVVLLLLVLGDSLVPVSAQVQNATCQEIASAISLASYVYYPGKFSNGRLLSPCS